MSFAPQVQVLNEPGKWHGNALRFPTKEEAEDNARDLMARWTLVVDTRVIETTDPVNYTYLNHQLRPIHLP